MGSDLEKIPQRNSFNINAFNIHGDPVDDQTTFYFDVGKGQVYAFNPQNGLLAVMISDYADHPSEDVKVYQDHPEHLYNDITVIRARNAKWHEDPMNNDITFEWMPGQPFDTLSVPKSHLIHIANQSEIDLYTVPRMYEHYQTGTIRTNQEDFLKIMFMRNGGELYKWQPYNHNGEMINHVDFVVQGWHETTGAPLSEGSIDQMKTIMQHVLDQYTLNNGVKLLDYRMHVAPTVGGHDYSPGRVTSIPHLRVTSIPQ